MVINIKHHQPVGKLVRHSQQRDKQLDVDQLHNHQLYSRLRLFDCLVCLGCLLAGCGDVPKRTAVQNAKATNVSAVQDTSDRQSAPENERGTQHNARIPENATLPTDVSKDTSAAATLTDTETSPETHLDTAPGYEPNLPLANDVQVLVSKMRAMGSKLTAGRIGNQANGGAVLEVQMDDNWIALMNGLDVPDYLNCMDKDQTPTHGLFFDAPNPLVLGFSSDKVSAYMINAPRQCISTWRVFEKPRKKGHRELTTIRVTAEYTDSKTHLNSGRAQSSGDFSVLDGAETLVATVDEVTLQTASGRPIFRHVTRFGKEEYHDCATVTATIFQIWGKDNITHLIHIKEHVPDCVCADAGADEATVFTYGLRSNGTHKLLSREYHMDYWHDKWGSSSEGTKKNSEWYFEQGEYTLMRRMQMRSDANVDSMALPEDHPKYKKRKCKKHFVPAETTSSRYFSEGASWMIVKTVDMLADAHDVFDDSTEDKSSILFSFELAPTVDKTATIFECAEDAF